MKFYAILNKNTKGRQNCLSFICRVHSGDRLIVESSCSYGESEMSGVPPYVIQKINLIMLKVENTVETV